jgi:hypothetical protein
MGTKQVLVDTREMSWGTDTHLYRSPGDLSRELPPRLGSGARVLKQHRGMGGQGVWKVELADSALGAPSALDSIVKVQHAQHGSVPELLPLDRFLERCNSYFDGAGRMIDQPFQERLEEGMVRIYLTHDRVVGFAHQHPRGLLPLLEDGEPAAPAAPFLGADAPDYRQLRTRMEIEWMPALQEIVGVETTSLPVIWDADLLYGPKAADGEDTYVLCEINVSSTFAFPEQALGVVAAATVARVRESR